MNQPELATGVAVKSLTLSELGVVKRHSSSSRIVQLSLSALIFFALYGALFFWRRDERTEIVSLTNLQRLANGALLYSQDWDGCPPPTHVAVSVGQVRTWSDFLTAYIEPKHLRNPAVQARREAANLIGCQKSKLRTDYAMNSRFMNRFGPGAYSFERLELPASTALIVSAGPARNSKDEYATFGTTEYDDILDMKDGYALYPASNRGKIAIACADGHAEVVEVAKQSEFSARSHDKTVGRIGGGVYNWNGGYPNGETDRPPHE